MGIKMKGIMDSTKKNKCVAQSGARKTTLIREI
jgi:hypothetical protein